MPENNPKKCLTVAIIGLPNSGKSTLVNLLVGGKISIVSPKAQTTRNQIRGILTEQDTQLIFIDTPGILDARPTKGQEKMQKEMMSLAWGGLEMADIVIFLVDASRKDSACLELCKKIAGGKAPVILVLNKTDKVSPEILLPLAKQLNEICNFKATFMISAAHGDGVQDLKKYLLAAAPLGPWIYAEDEITDAPAKFIATEITREQIFLKFHEEIPYFCQVETEKWQEDETRLTIHQLIYVARESQKKIIVGAKGQGIKEIGSAARAEMQKFFGKKIGLFLFVKVEEKWLNQINLSQLQ